MCHSEVSHEQSDCSNDNITSGADQIISPTSSTYRPSEPEIRFGQLGVKIASYRLRRSSVKLSLVAIGKPYCG